MAYNQTGQSMRPSFTSGGGSQQTSGAQRPGGGTGGQYQNWGRSQSPSSYQTGRWNPGAPDRGVPRPSPNQDISAMQRMMKPGQGSQQPGMGAQPGGNMYQGPGKAGGNMQPGMGQQMDPHQMAAMNRMMQGGPSLRSLYEQRLPGAYAAAGMAQPTPYGPGHPVWERRNRPPRRPGELDPVNGVPVGNKQRVPAGQPGGGQLPPGMQQAGQAALGRR